MSLTRLILFSSAPLFAIVFESKLLYLDWIPDAGAPIGRVPIDVVSCSVSQRAVKPQRPQVHD